LSRALGAVRPKFAEYLSRGHSGQPTLANPPNNVSAAAVVDAGGFGSYAGKFDDVETHDKIGA